MPRSLRPSAPRFGWPGRCRSPGFISPPGRSPKARTKPPRVRRARPMPVAGIYLTGWASPDGTIHFRKDVYDLDPKPAVATTIDVGRPMRVSAARASGFVLQSDDAPTFRPVSYLDSR